jgi:hypothetical protein
MGIWCKTLLGGGGVITRYLFLGGGFAKLGVYEKKCRIGIFTEETVRKLSNIWKRGEYEVKKDA